MAKPATRQDFIEYCLRKLGKPVININVATEQTEDRVDEALETYYEKHYDGTYQEWLSYPVTQEDIDNGYITLPEDIQSVTTIMDVNEIYAHTNMFSFQYQIAMETLSPWQPFDAVDYVMKVNNYNSISDLTSVVPTFNFIKHGNRLKINYDFPVGYPLALQVVRVVDPAVFTGVWNDKWLKEYATALIKRQWGENTKKFEQIQLLGGVTISGQQLFDEALQEIEELERTLEETYMEPTDFVVG